MLITVAFLMVLSSLSIHGQYLNVSFLNADLSPDDFDQVGAKRLALISSASVSVSVGPL